MIISFASSSSINNSNETLGCESSRLSLITLIEDRALRFCHVACEEEASRNVRCWIFIACLRCCQLSLKVHQVHWISIFITPQMNGYDWIVLTKMIRHQISMQHVPPPFKWKWRITIKTARSLTLDAPRHLKKQKNLVPHGQNQDRNHI